jgi:dihydroorotase
MAFDLVLAGGRVIDPSQNIDGVMDVGFAGGRVVQLGHALEGARLLNVAGRIVTPGLIDLHTHVYSDGTSISIDAEHFARISGVTTAVDTGSAGPGNFAGFRKHVIERSAVRILAYLHISHAGIFAYSWRVMVGESEEIRLMDPISTVEVADEVGLPLMAHIDDPPPTYEDVLARLRPGDILTHAFRPFPNAPVSAQGRVKPAVTAARERGVIFDIGHGKGSFAFKVARAMLANGFPPDTISSDVHALCIDGPAFDLVTTMSKFLCLGMDLAEVVRCATRNPAMALHRPELGTFQPGNVGDATILSLDEGRFDYVDVVGEHLIGTQKLSSKGVVIAGQLWHGG